MRYICTTTTNMADATFQLMRKLARSLLWTSISVALVGLISGCPRSALNNRTGPTSQSQRAHKRRALLQHSLDTSLSNPLNGRELCAEIMPTVLLASIASIHTNQPRSIITRISSSIEPAATTLAQLRLAQLSNN